MQRTMLISVVLATAFMALGAVREREPVVDATITTNNKSTEWSVTGTVTYSRFYGMRALGWTGDGAITRTVPFALSIPVDGPLTSDIYKGLAISAADLQPVKWNVSYSSITIGCLASFIASVATVWLIRKVIARIRAGNRRQFEFGRQPVANCESLPTM